LSFLSYKRVLKNTVYTSITEKKARGEKLLAVLIDPDSMSDTALLAHTCTISNKAGVDLILVGGSLITNGFFEECVAIIKEHTSIPVLLFPGSVMQVSSKADGILLLSLISGRNADLLIGKHVIAAPHIKKSGIEVIPTGYMLIDGGRSTSVSYMSNTLPIPADKPAIAATTALAGELLGLQCIYMDAGSGADNPIPPTIIEAVSKQVNVPVFVGGGMKHPDHIRQACLAGADVVVVGNAFEKDPELIAELKRATSSSQSGV
jgi:phosphoglycerol geranylgeranyltransferase